MTSPHVDGHITTDDERLRDQQTAERITEQSASIRIGSWTITPMFYGDMAYVAEHDEYDGSSRFPCFHGATVPDVTEQITAWTEENRNV